MEKRLYRDALSSHRSEGYMDKVMGSIPQDFGPKGDNDTSLEARNISYSRFLSIGFVLGCGVPVVWFIVEKFIGLSGDEFYYRGIVYLYMTLVSIAIFMTVAMIIAVRIERERDAHMRVIEKEREVESLSNVSNELKRSFREEMIKVSNSAVAISKAANEKEILHTLIRTVKNNLDFDRILVLVKDGDRLVMSNSFGSTDRNLCDLNMELPYSDLAGAFAVVCREGESCMFSEDDYIPHEFRVKPPYADLDRFRSKAFMVVPIRKPGESEAYGVIAADRKYTRQRISESDLILVELLADMAGSAISRIEMNRNLERQASMDELTQIYNRRRWMETAEQSMKTVKRYGGDLSMVIIDIDDFKSINDTYGHQSGDKVLMETAAIIKEYSREADIVGRYGGEEFVILCPRSDLFSTVEVADRLRRIIGETSFGIPRKVTATFGVAQATWEEIETLDVDSLLSKADKALYAGKSRKGKNCVVTWDEIQQKLSPLHEQRVSAEVMGKLKMKDAI